MTARVLVVDDVPSARKMLADLLKLQQFQVFEASTGTEAMTMLEQHPGIELVVTDYNMPDMDGYEVAKRIRSQPVSTPPRLYALTGYGRDQDRAQALAAGFDGHFTKPVDPYALLATITGS